MIRPTHRHMGNGRRLPRYIVARENVLYRRLFIHGIYVPYKVRTSLWQIALWCVTFGWRGKLRQTVYKFHWNHPPTINCRCVVRGLNHE